MEKKKLPIYKLTITGTDTDTGVTAIALVDDPAIERNFQAFAAQKQPLKFEVSDKDQHILSGPLMVPDMLIYRSAMADLPEHYVFFDAPTIKAIALKFFCHEHTNAINLMHDPEAKVPDCFIFESMLIDASRGIASPKGFNLPEGSWFGSIKVNNDVVWDEFIKTGIFKGFSVEGIFEYNEPASGATEEQASKMLKDILEILSEVE